MQEDSTVALTPQQIRDICDRHFGLGSDGILTGPHFPDTEDFRQISEARGLPSGQDGRCFCALRILNPDGSEAEKSGNGLRIFSRYLFDRGWVNHEPFQLLTLGGQVQGQVLSEQRIRVDMGQVSFSSKALGFAGGERDVVDERWSLDGRDLRVTAASIGNPHCIVLCVQGENLKDMAMELGPRLELHPDYPARTNVQFLRPVDEHAIEIEIWERGAGYTLASGSSASACAAAAIRLGFCRSPVEVRMPGGILHVEATTDFHMRQLGPVGFIGVMDYTPDGFAI